MKSKLIVYFIFFLFINSATFGQFLKFTGFATHDNEAIEGASVLVLENDKVITQTQTNDKGFFLVKLTFNHNYVIKFEKQGFCKMYALVNGSVPEDKQDYNIKFEIRVPFFDFEQKELNLKVFEKPITKVYFDGNSRFIDDPLYITNFYKELNNEILLQKTEEKRLEDYTYYDLKEFFNKSETNIENGTFFINNIPDNNYFGEIPIYIAPQSIYNNLRSGELSAFLFSEYNRNHNPNLRQKYSNIKQI
jgi:hypothetical protein